jgi:hypothetical protein
VIITQFFIPIWIQLAKVNFTNKFQLGGLSSLGFGIRRRFDFKSIGKLIKANKSYVKKYIFIYLFNINRHNGGNPGYLWVAPRDSQILKPFFPKTLFSIENAPSQVSFGK